MEFFKKHTLRSVTLHINCILQYLIIYTILGRVSGESVWVKSLGEHDNVDNFVQLSCSVRDFNHTLSPQTPFILYHKKLEPAMVHSKKRYMVKVCSFEV